MSTALVDAPVAEAPDGTPEQRRFVADIQRVHANLSLAGLAESVPAEHVLYHAHRPDGLTVLALRHGGIPQRYLIAIHGFRLAQYLRLRFADPQLAYQRALFAEPHAGPEHNEVHVLALDPSGAILRYVSLVSLPEGSPADPCHPDRPPFPCERAHGVNLFDHVRFEEPVRTEEVWEVKRLVHRETGDSPEVRMRTTLELMLGFFTALRRITPAVRLLVGDGEEAVAIRRTLRSMREVTVLEGTTPALPDDDLMAPLYTQREEVRAFVGRAPNGAELDRLLDRLSRALDSGDLLPGIKALSAAAGGEIRRIKV